MINLQQENKHMFNKWMEIHKLDNATFIQLLYARYVRLQKFEQIVAEAERVYELLQK